MARCTSVAPLGSQFDEFLFAPIGEEKNGVRLSVVSALARMGKDPWQEAAQLAQLPGPGAIRKLASLIETLPDAPAVYLGPMTTAARLIALLPRDSSSFVRAPNVLRGGAGTGINRDLVMSAIFCFVFWIALLTSQLVLTSRGLGGSNVGVHVPVSQQAAERLGPAPNVRR